MLCAANSNLREKRTDVSACALERAHERRGLEHRAVFLGAHGAVLGLMARLLRAPEQLREASRGLLQTSIAPVRSSAAALRLPPCPKQRRTHEAARAATTLW